MNLGSLIGRDSQRPSPSDDTRSNAGGLMSKFNPLGLIGSIFGKKKPGQSMEGMTGTEAGMRKGFGAKNGKSAYHTTKIPQVETPAPPNESVTNISAKIYTLLRRDYNRENDEYNQEKKEKKSLMRLKERRNKELIDALTPSNKKVSLEPLKTVKQPTKRPVKQKKTEKPTAPKAAPKSTAQAAPKPTPSAAPAAPKPAVSTAAKVAVGTGAAIASASSFAAGPLAENIVASESKVSSPSKGKKTKWKNNSEYNAYNKGTITNEKGKQVTLGADFDQNQESVVDFSKMTIEEYLRRGKLKSGDPNKIFAAGRYQIIPSTMEEIVKKLKLDPKTTYLTNETQDYLFMAGLIGQKRKKVKQYIDGDPKVSREDAIMELAQEFASIGVPYDTKYKGKDIKKGQSYYSQNTKSGLALNPPEEVGKALDAERLKQMKEKATSSPTSQTSPAPNTTSTGQDLNRTSQENKDMKQQSQQGQSTIINNVNTVVVDSSPQPQTMVKPKNDSSNLVNGARK